MPRLTIDKTTETFDREIDLLKKEVEAIDTDIADLRSKRIVAVAQLVTAENLRAFVLDDASDDDND